MVLQALPDARQMVHDVDAMLAQVRLWADAGQQQDMGRSDRSAAQDHFLTGAYKTRDARFLERNANGPLALEDHPFGQCAR